MPLLLTILSITTVQIPAVILRYLPFSKIIQAKEKKRLFICYGLCFILQHIFLYVLLKDKVALISPLTYKRLLFVLSITYVAFNMFIIKKMIFRHLFIYGMQGGYSLLIHSVVAIFVGRISPMFPVYLELSIQTSLYLVLITIITLPLWKVISRSIIFNSEITNEYYWNIIWLIPAFAIYSDSIVTMNNQWLNSFPQILSRLMTALSLIVSWKWITLDLKSLENTVYLKNLNKMLYVQTEGLTAQAHLLKESEKHISICKHDMRHHLRMLSALIEAQKTEDALDYIKTFDANISTTSPTLYCLNTIINSAFLVYTARAKEQGIHVSTELNIPEEIPWNSNDIAILIANAFENAIIASSRQGWNEKEICVTANVYSNNLAIVIKNRFAGEILLGDNGFPISNEIGHGIGIQSMLSIADKYDAYANCSNADGWFTVTFLFTHMP